MESTYAPWDQLHRQCETFGVLILCTKQYRHRLRLNAGQIGIGIKFRGGSRFKDAVDSPALPRKNTANLETLSNSTIRFGKRLGMSDDKLSKKSNFLCQILFWKNKKMRHDAFIHYTKREKIFIPTVIDHSVFAEQICNTPFDVSIHLTLSKQKHGTSSPVYIPSSADQQPKGTNHYGNGRTKPLAWAFRSALRYVYYLLNKQWMVRHCMCRHKRIIMYI